MYTIILSKEQATGYLHADLTKGMETPNSLKICGITSDAFEFIHISSLSIAVRKLLKFNKDFQEYNLNIGPYIPRSKR